MAVTHLSQEFASPPTRIRAPHGNLAIAAVGLALVPLALLADTLIATVRGWPAAARGNYGQAMIVGCVAALVVSGAAYLVALAIGPLRRLLRRYSWHLLCLNASLIVGWALAEVLLAVAWPDAPFHGRPPGTTYVLDADPFTFYRVGGDAYSSINSLGLRGPELPPPGQATRILCVGGSTTECYYLDDDEWWPGQLARHLERDTGRPVWVGAAAVSEFGAAQHLQFLQKSSLPPEMDAVVVMPGVNDFVRLILGFPTGAEPGPLWSRTRVLKLAKAEWNRRSGGGRIVDPTGERLHLQRLGGDIDEPPGGLRLDGALAAYTHLLEQICESARRRGVRLVLVTQPVLWTDFLSTAAKGRLNLARELPFRRPWEFLEAVELADAFERYNEATLETAHKHGIPVFDAALALSGREEFFYDDYHLNEAGCAALGTALARWFVEHSEVLGQARPVNRP